MVKLIQLCLLAGVYLLTESKKVYKKPGGLKGHRLLNGLQIVSGSEEEIEIFKQEIDDELDNIAKEPKSKSDKVGDRYDSLKKIIQRQMITEVIDSIKPITIDGRPWNKTIGLPPLRGSYNSKMLTHDLESLGFKKDASAGLEKVLPEHHYCKNRRPNDGELECCKGENTECYTAAGCFCDESCFTKYGDCCTDHYKTCYQQLKLCLITTKQDPQHKPSAVQDEYEGIHDVAKPINHVTISVPNAQNDLMKRSFGANIEKLDNNACCLAQPYNTMEEHPSQTNKKKSCCDGAVMWIEDGKTCPVHEVEEFV